MSFRWSLKFNVRLRRQRESDSRTPGRDLTQVDGHSERLKNSANFCLKSLSRFRKSAKPLSNRRKTQKIRTAQNAEVAQPADGFFLDKKFADRVLDSRSKRC